MNIDDINGFIERGESTDLELKKSTGQRTEAAKTVCAMLNGIGGFVVFGITPDRNIIGQSVSEKTLEDLYHELQRIEPPAFPQIDIVPLPNGQKVIILTVAGGAGSELYTYDGRPYHRQGPTTSRMPRQQYDRLLIERMHASHRWENQPATGISSDDLDPEEILRTIEEAIRRGRMEDPGTRDLSEILMGLGLIHDGELLNAAVVLFGRSDRLLPLYPQCVLRMARFRGIDKNEFIDNRQEYGNAFQLLIRAQRFLLDHLPVAGRIVPNLFERIDDPLYPTEALREALANALCHRDYGVPGGAVSIAIFDDRLEISSTGILPFGLTPDDLTRPHRSRPWNPLIAQVFFRRGIIEQWGRGTLKIAELTERAGLVPPEFESRSGEVLVRFRPTRYVPPTRVGHLLTPLQRSVLEVLARSGPSQLQAIMSRLPSGTPERTVQDNLQMLRLLDMVDVIGRGRGARWLLRADNPSMDGDGVPL
ncbi:MAG TPA: ATP-binding protein [Thermomicrobiales bacterium]|jgi:ATP-dependent DNA helicase RecG|nr:AAA family ATPase [Chloroflexota bacterium]HCG28749.1 AAA family ATPase [Chloroflexota bacterium]HQX62013.1 ATP-binding protein [Thermomicrobiales bacterium]HQZ90888.1 ATP-binding protein [Thermomicrobiales bacterium]HRA32756.1 ATP-binding protein [Thermomicrobiales bacterium]